MANGTEERVNIITLEIDQDEALKDLAGLSTSLTRVNKELKALEEQQKQLRKDGKTSGEQYKKNAAEIELQRVNAKSLRKEYLAQQKVVSEVLTSNEKQLGTLQKLTKANKELRQEQRELNLDTEEGIERSKEINDELEQNTEIINENSDSFVQQKMNIGNYQSALSALPPGLNKVKGGITAMTTAARAFIATPLGLVLAAVAAVVAVVGAAYKKSQIAMDGASVTMKAFVTVADVVIDRVSNRLEKAFAGLRENPTKAIKEFAGSIRDDIVNRVKVLPKLFVKVFAAIRNTMEGDLKMSRKAAREAGEAIIKLQTGMDPGQAVKYKNSREGLRKEMQREAIAAGELQRAYNKLLDREIDLIVSNEKLRKEREQSRLIAKDERVSTENRIKAQERAIEIDQKLLSQEIEVANERVRIMEEQLALGKVTRKEREELAEIQAEAIRLETLFFSRNKEITTELNTLRNKIAGEEKMRSDERIAQRQAESQELEEFLNNEVEIWALKNQSIIEGEKELSEQLVQVETERLQDLANMRIAILESSLSDGLITQQEFDLQKLLLEVDTNQQIALINKTFADQQLSDEQKQQLRLMRLEQDIIANRLDSKFALERERLEQWYSKQQELAKGNAAELLKIEEAHSGMRKQIALDEITARANATQKVLKNVQSLFEEGTAAYKATATAVILIDTLKGAIAAYSSLAGIPVIGPVLGGIAAGAAVAAGGKAIQKVWAVNEKSGASGVDNPVAGSGSVAIPAATITNDGGLVVRDAEASASDSIKNSFLEALIEAPVKDVAIVDQITRDQNNQAAIENLSSV